MSARGAYAGWPPLRVLMADPAWKFGDRLGKRGAASRYRCSALRTWRRFPLPPLADNCALFLWRVAAGNEDESLAEAAYGVARAWGFTPRTEVGWVKTRPCRACAGRGFIALVARGFGSVREWCARCAGRGHRVAFGLGHYVRGAHEVCLIATRGRAPVVSHRERSVFFAPLGEHSAKPEAFYDLVRRLYPEGPHGELFARARRPGWHQHGKELPRA